MSEKSAKKPTIVACAPVPDNQNAVTAGPRGPMLLQDVWFLEKLAHFDQEVIPERRIRGQASKIQSLHSLDGHHRYYAYLELGKKVVNCAFAGDFSGVFFFMTQQGYFQPKTEVRKEMLKPIPFLHENIEEFLHNFLKDPNKSAHHKKENQAQRIN